MNTQSDAHIRECNERKAEEHYATLTGADKDLADAKARVRVLERNVMRSQAAIIRETESIASNAYLLKAEIDRLIAIQGLVAA